MFFCNGPFISINLYSFFNSINSKDFLNDFAIYSFDLVVTLAKIF